MKRTADSLTAWELVERLVRSEGFDMALRLVVMAGAESGEADERARAAEVLAVVRRQDAEADAAIEEE